ncbi:MAG: tRNA 4-thiouridine(8) synthase ThiI [Gammaproteobacteria bacterium]|nr:tRNA 4-thiouridine(8) synthase ThiI [Gammaproteobacteria bacterium]
MKIVVKLFHEIAIKSRPVRKLLTKQLHYNLESLLKRIRSDTKVYRHWDRFEIKVPEDICDDTRRNIIEQLSNTPGIEFFLVVEPVHFSSLSELTQIALEYFAQSVNQKTFAVRVKRKGKHSFSSIEAEREIGSVLMLNAHPTGVDLKQPEVEISIEIDNETAYLVKEKVPGLGGYPLGKQEQALSLISGGYDSSVSSFLTMRRGVKTHFCFFNLGGSAHEIGVKQVAYYIWNKYASTHKVKFITFDFEPVVAEILKSIDPSFMGVVLKRMMFRAAEYAAKDLAIETVVTGEAIGQVSSQTLTNLNAIQQVTDRLVLRPLVAMDKQDIIKLAKEIGTDEFAANMPEYCGVISSKPSTKVKLEKVVAAENDFDFDVLEKSLNTFRLVSIEKVLDGVDTDTEVDSITTPNFSDVVIDIRHPEEQEKNPLQLLNNEIIKIPFYSISKRFEDLDSEKNYLLYCDKGVMSKVQAHHLKIQGFTNVKVLKLAV